MNQIFGNPFYDIGNHHNLLEKDPKNDDSHTFFYTNANPEDEQWYNRGDGQLADKVDQRFQKSLNDSEATHQ